MEMIKTLPAIMASVIVHVANLAAARVVLV